MTYGQYMNDLSGICTRVWATDNIAEKKNLLKEAVSTFKYKEKKNVMLKAIDSTVNRTTLDTIASNLILNKTDKVI